MMMREKTFDELDDFIDDSDQPVDDVNFYRQSDLTNIELYHTRETRNPLEAVYEEDESYFRKEDTQPELYAPKDRDLVKEIQKDLEKFCKQ